jgi:hypothetical protein
MTGKRMDDATPKLGRSREQRVGVGEGDTELDAPRVRIFRFLNIGRAQDLDSILYCSDKFMRVAWYRSLQRQQASEAAISPPDKSGDRMHQETGVRCKLLDSYSYQNLAGCGNAATVPCT